MRGIIALTSTALLAACSSASGPRPEGPTGLQGGAPLVRNCASAVFGEPNSENAVSLGPLMLVGIPQAARLSSRAFKPHDGRYSAIKVLAVVMGPNDVTVTVPSSQRHWVSLLYDPTARATRNGFLLSAGDPRVTFKTCQGGEPQYNGGFIATKPGCVRLEIESRTSSTSDWISLGAGDSCPTDEK
jgi:hypothetical protein